MKPTFRNLFIQIQIIEVPHGLCASVVERIVLHERYMAKRRLILESFVLVFSIFGFVVVLDTVIKAFTESGFYQYLQLIFSGDTSILTYWQEIGLSLVESLPIFASAALLATVALFLWSAIGAARNARTLLSPSLA